MIDAGAVLGTVEGWLLRAGLDDDVGELLLFVQGGEITIEEHIRRPYQRAVMAAKWKAVNKAYVAGPGRGKKTSAQRCADVSDPKIGPTRAQATEMFAVSPPSMTTRWRLRGCGRCGGDLFWNANTSEYECFQCGALV